jgi:uncharacterized damage-inducible protein DinB
MVEATSQRTLIELLYGKGAHVNPLAAVKGINAQLAARKIEGYPHSISEIVRHMNYWMDYEVRRINGEKPRYPEHASESWPTDPVPPNQTEWNRLVVQFAELIDRLAILANTDSNSLNHTVTATQPNRGESPCSVLDVLWQTAVHNSYHEGQIVLMRRALNAWPADAGDTW